MNHLRFQGASNTRMSVQQGSLIEDECGARRKGFQPTREEPSRLELVTSIGPTPTRQKVLVPSLRMHLCPSTESRPWFTSHSNEVLYSAMVARRSPEEAWREKGANKVESIGRGHSERR